MAWYDYLLGGAAGGAASGGINSFLHPEKGYEDAAKKLQEQWNQAQGFQQPYNQAGQAQLPTLTGAENNLLNPTDMLNKWIGSYEESPYAKQLFGASKESGLDAASSMGLMGSSAALNNIQQSGSDIMNADRQNYLNDLMNKYMQGVGIGQNIYGVGADTAKNMGNQAIQVGQGLGTAAFGAANAPGDRIAQLLGDAAKGAMQYASGGMGG